MPVTISVDIGTAIISLPLIDQAIAYAVAYSPDGSKAQIDVKLYSEADFKSGSSPAEVFSKLVRATPGVWIDTYSNLDSLRNLEPHKKEFLHINLAYNTDTYSWYVARDEQMDFLMSLCSGQLPAVPESMFGNMPDFDRVKNKQTTK